MNHFFSLRIQPCKYKNQPFNGRLYMDRLYRKNLLLIVILLSFSFVLLGCQKNNKDNNLEGEEAFVQVYYIETDERNLVSEDYRFQSDTPEEGIQELLEMLSSNPRNSSIKKAIPDSIYVSEYELLEDGRLRLDFNSEYNNLTGISEVLCRAAIVRTLAQIECVDYIEFTIGGQPVMDSDGRPIGLMEERDFISSTNAENVYVTVYFANTEGNALIDSNLRITYDGNISIPELIIKRLIAGPIEKDMRSTIPEGTELINAITREGICYVDFNEHFLGKAPIMTEINEDIENTEDVEGVPEVKREIMIYSVVNSLVELSYINKVKFTINGETIEDYNGIPFGAEFERKLELIEGSR